MVKELPLSSIIILIWFVIMLLASIWTYYYKCSWEYELPVLFETSKRTIEPWAYDKNGKRKSNEEIQKFIKKRLKELRKS